MKSDVTNKAREAFIRECHDSVNDLESVNINAWDDDGVYKMHTGTSVWGCFWALRWVFDDYDLNDDLEAYFDGHCKAVVKLYNSVKENDDV